ncbi:class I SAM-dependent methyltransferase [Maribacter sp. 2210JD10-5]|uniref:class I SAM-dependent methyltransferase n=1 Tax=Maribacter sp. 2210JD10-5 TaxID=3386272 RepID=UPI0039BD5E71
MNPVILEQEVQDYIAANLKSDPIRLLFKKSPFPNISQKELVAQIEAKSKSEKKLPTWFSRSNIYYANKLNISQTSSEATATYKAKLLNGKTVIDLTGGFGVDTFAFSKCMDTVFHLEKNKSLSAIAAHNFSVLGKKNINIVEGDGIEFLKNSDQDFDWIYIDPSRRSENNKKVFFLEDCEPNVTQHLDLFFSRSENILIKTGPLLDISSGIKQLKNVSEIHIVALKNEVKEILWLLYKNHHAKPIIKAVNISEKSIHSFDFTIEEEKSAIAEYSEPKIYLYEPNAAILKSGAYNTIAERFKLKKLHQHSHLYTADTLIDFPGRSFKIEFVSLYNKKAIKSFDFKRANITTRNFPYSVVEIRQKTRLADGGDIYLFFTTSFEDKLVILQTSKV